MQGCIFCILIIPPYLSCSLALDLRYRELGEVDAEVVSEGTNLFFIIYWGGGGGGGMNCATQNLVKSARVPTIRTLL